MLVEPTTKSFQRTDNHQFVCQYKNPEYYLPRCFPTIYPYGRGCPSDSNCKVISMANYVKHMLCLGGGPDARRFQQNAKFILPCIQLRETENWWCCISRSTERLR